MFQRTTLENGLRVITSPMPETRSVTVTFYIGAGNRYEGPPIAGVSHFVEHMLFKGSRKRPTARDISEAVDNVGGVLNAATDRELTVYYIKAAHSHLDLAFDVLLDMLHRPLFDPSEVEKERKVIIEELAMVADNPSQLAEVRLDALLWPEGPLGWDVAGTEESVSAIPRDETLAYVARQYVPNNTVLSVAGNVNHEQVVEMCRSQLIDWHSGSPQSWSPAGDGWRGPGITLLNKRTEQTQVMLAVRGVSSRHPDRHAVDLLSAILGEGMSSRLFMELRERRSLCYDVHTYATHYLDAGAFSVYAGVDPSNTAAALVAILQELAEIRGDVPEAELQKAKEITKGHILLRMEDTRSVAGWAGGQELLHNEVKTVDQVVSEVEAVTTHDVRRVARDLLQTDRLALSIVGPHRSDKRFAPLLKI
ncbi:MAG TPA: pitrilysin family protein [Dehalococcoidia bacterium]|nr:pitrilysin family protein [Dehalococcoidia bacterium]